MKYQLDLSNVKTKEEFHELIREILPAPDYYGNNLDALNDILWDHGEGDLDVQVIGMDKVPEDLKGYMEAFRSMAEDVSEENPTVNFTFGEEDGMEEESFDEEVPVAIYAVLMAGGRGSRMEGDIPKQFRMVGDKPLIIHSLMAMVDSPYFRRVIIPLPEEHIELMGELIESYCPEAGIIDLIVGGEERAETLEKALNYIEDTYGLEEWDIVLTHDAARPNLSQRMMKESIESALTCGASTCAIQATDTIAYSTEGEVVEDIIDRDSIYRIQTPQTFIAKLYMDIWEQLKEEYSFTDVTGVFNVAEFSVAIVQGDRWNLKITYEEDLIVAEALLNNREEL